MQLCLVKGTVTCTVKHHAYNGEKLLMLRPIMYDGRETGKMFLGIDRVSARAGDTVLVIREGSSARSIYGDSTAPIHCVAAAIVDEIQLSASAAGKK